MPGQPGCCRSDHSRDTLRFALASRHVAYGENLVYPVLIYQSMKAGDGAIHMSFTQTGGGLAIAETPYRCLYTALIPTDHLFGLKIAGADQHFVPALVVIDGDTMLSPVRRWRN